MSVSASHEGAKIVVCYNKGEARANEVVASLAGSGHRTQHIVLEDWLLDEKNVPV